MGHLGSIIRKKSKHGLTHLIKELLERSNAGQWTASSIDLPYNMFYGYLVSHAESHAEGRFELFLVFIIRESREP